MTPIDAARSRAGSGAGAGCKAALAAGLAGAALLTAGPAAADVRVIGDDEHELRLGAYASQFSLFSHIGYEAGGFVPQDLASNAALLRLEWSARLGPRWTFVLHDRFFWLMSNQTSADGTGVGLGSSIPPRRSIDLESHLVDASGASLTHDLDRLALSHQSPIGDLTLGRQAISWGTASVFTINDLWSRFGPFELDTSQKRGVDALRLLSYPLEGGELDLVLVDRGGLDEGNARDLSGGARLAWSQGATDHYVGLAKNYRRLLLLGGTTVDLDVFTARLEAQVRFSFSPGRVEPLVTAGVDYQGPTSSLAFEYHFSSPGITDRADYARELVFEPDPELARGDRYFAGEHYVAATGTYNPWVDLQLGGAVIANVLDPSAIFVPSISYAISQNVSAALGAYIGAGNEPNLVLGAEPTLKVDSEFGMVGTVGYFQITGYM